MRKFCLYLTLATVALGAFQVQAATAVPEVDVLRFYGRWYEQRRLSNDRQDDFTRDSYGPCRNSTADYAPFTEGRMLVTRSCIRFNKAGPKLHSESAYVTPIPGSNHAKLTVKYRSGFFLFRWLGVGNGEEWVMTLGPVLKDGTYSWMILGSPKFDSGWILSRQEKMDPAELTKAINLMGSMGFMVERLLML